MKRIMFMGPVGCGKTTLCQRLNGEKRQYRKTQAVEVIGNAIDTPGEYIENRNLMHALTMTAIDADVVAFVQDATSDRNCFSPCQADMFACPVIGIITKVDIASQAAVEAAAQTLRYAGAEAIFYSPDLEERLEHYIATWNGEEGESGRS